MNSVHPHWLPAHADWLVEAAPDNLAAHCDDSANRDFARVAGAPRLLERRVHEHFVVHVRSS